MAETQVIRIEIDGFPPDEFEVVSFRGTEGISTLFRYSIVLASKSPTQDFDALLEAKAHLILGDPPMNIRGMLASVQQNYEGAWKTEAGTLTRFDIVLVPTLYALTLTSRTRIFQEMNSVEVIKKILSDAAIPGDDIEWRLSGEPEKKEFILQYEETDLDFIQRLAEHDGIHYHFEHQEDVDKLVFGNSNTAFNPISGEPAVRLGIPDPTLGISAVGPWGHEQTHHRFQSRQRVVTKKVTHNDYNFLKPSLALTVDGEISDTRASMGENYLFGEHYLEPNVGQRLNSVRREEIMARKRVYTGEGTVRRLYAGGVFSLTGVDDIDAVLAQKYLVIETASEGSQPLIHAKQTRGYHYANQFTCIPESIPFRPERRTATPTVPGVVHAKICAPSGGGKYAHLDDMGRYKVQFMWDRDGQNDDKASCWVRLVEPYTGQGFGFHLPMLAGHEVLVSFENGDPHRPVIIGGVYNFENTNPVTNRNHAQSVWRSSGQNEIRFDDTEGSEHVFLHGTKDWQIAIDNDKSQTIGHDETMDVKNDRTRTVGHDQTVTINNDKTTDVKNNHKETIGVNQTITVGADKTEEIGVNASEKVGATKKIDVKAAFQTSVMGAMNTSVGGGKATEVKGPVKEVYGSSQDINVSKNIQLAVGENVTEAIKGDHSETTGKKFSLVVKDIITVESKKDIVLKTAKCSITLKEDGTIVLDGKDIQLKGSGEIVAKASKDMTLKGKNILQN
jgi:type VI secretion system secreted protein VgrG